MLDTQYRMHPEISEFPRTKFYGGLLKDGIDANARQLEGVISSPLYFGIPRGMQENNLLETSFVKMEVTYTNRDEIGYIQQVLRTLINKGVKPEQIGIITPYSGQRDLISATLVKDDVINPSNKQMKTEVDIDDLKMIPNQLQFI